MSVLGYGDQRCKPRLNQYAVSSSKTLHQHCISRLICEISAIQEQPREGCLFSAMSLPVEIALKSLQIVLHQNLILNII